MADVTDTSYAGVAFIGYGSQFLVGDGASPEGFEAVADVVSIQFGEMSTQVVDKTHLRSPAAHREKLAAIRDSGPFTVMMNYRPAHESQNNTGGGSGSFTGGGLNAMWIARTTHNFQIKLSDGDTTVLPFTGVVTKFQPGAVGVDAKVDCTVEITPVSDFSANLP